MHSKVQLLPANCACMYLLVIFDRINFATFGFCIALLYVFEIVEIKLMNEKK